MRLEEITYICDICGRKLSIEKTDEICINNISLPNNWRVMVPYGDVCTKCCEELDGVYNRIHAPIRAREEAYGDQRQRQSCGIA